MAKNNLWTGKEAQDKLMRGVDAVADAVKGTLGAAGHNGILETFEHPYTQTTNDGISIARSIMREDPVENMGANIIKEIASRSDKQGGDGTTTATVLAQAILHEGIKYEGSPMVLKKSLEECLPIIEANIKEQTKTITVDEVGKVAAVSAEDESIGALIQEIYQKIGADGILYPDVSKTFEDHYSIGSGVKIEGAGLASPYMADVDDKSMQPLNAAQVKNASVLVTKQKITNARGDLETIIGQLMGKSVRDLVIFADDMEPTVIPDLVTTRFKSGFRTVVVKLPTLWKDQWFEDIARLTNATVIDPAAGLNFKTMRLAHLGTVGSFLADKNDTFLDATEDISSYIQTLHEDGTDESKIRAARLNTKTARLFVGAPSDAALAYKRLKVEDARNAAYQALHGGIVAGGGVALLNASHVMPDTVGGKILRDALKAPMVQISMNAGHEPWTYWENNGNPSLGFDAKTGNNVDMFEAGICDPATVVMSSVRNAISVAATVLTAKVVVTLVREPAENVSVPAM